MEYSVKEALEILRGELDAHPYMVKDALGNAAVDRMVRNLIFACIKEGLPKSDCDGYFDSIINSYPFESKDIESICYLIKLYYAAKNLLDSGAYQFR